MSKTGNTLIDEYMDPAHLQLGNDGYKKLQEDRVRTVGASLLRYLHDKHPEFHAYSQESKVKFRASPEGEITAFAYELKSKYNSGFASRIFPKILLRVSSDHGMMPLSVIDIMSDTLKKDSRLESLARNLGKEHHFSVK